MFYFLFWRRGGFLTVALDQTKLLEQRKQQKNKSLNKQYQEFVGRNIPQKLHNKAQFSDTVKRLDKKILVIKQIFVLNIIKNVKFKKLKNESMNFPGKTI